MKDARGRELTCQEVVSGHPVTLELTRCGRNATSLVDAGDSQPYWLCAEHTSHYVRNRGGVEYVQKVKVCRECGKPMTRAHDVGLWCRGCQRLKEF